MTWALHCAKKKPAMINKCALLKNKKSQTLHYLHKNSRYSNEILKLAFPNLDMSEMFM
jgi:hypothetical protein